MTEFRQSRRSRFFFLVLAALLVSGTGYQLAQVRLSRPDVLEFAQAKASEILKADTKIGKIRYLPPAQIAFQGIRMNEPSSEARFSIGRIERLVLGYGLLNLIRGDFRIPGIILFDAPEIRFHSNASPFPFLDSFSSSSKDAPLARLGIRKGVFRYPWGTPPQELVLSKVRFRAEPDARGQIHLELTSQVAGMASGKIEVKGVTDPQFRRYELEVSLDDVSFSPESRIPLRKVRGNFRLTEKSLEIAGLTSLFHDWDVEWKGRIDDWQAQPKVALEVNRKKGETPSRFSVTMNFESQELQGQWSWIGQTYPFRGRAALDQGKIIFSNVELPRGYVGKGEFDRSNGDYRFWFERGERRFQIQSSLSKLEFETEFQLDHALVNHLDWVVRGRARLVPLPKQVGDKGPRLKGEIETDYFIVEFEPLEDFQGTFELNSEGLDALDFRWGGAFHLNGRILFAAGEAREDLLLRIDGFPLDHLRDFANRPLPSNLGGGLEGKLKLRGPVKRPEVEGYFTIKEGTIEKLDYDRAVVQFRGFPPYLELYDSKIFRGRNTLQLVGALDLRLANILHGIQIKGPDHLVIWKGMSIYWKGNESAIEAEKPLAGKVGMGVAVGTGGTNSDRENPEETHALFGPKVKF